MSGKQDGDKHADLCDVCGQLRHWCEGNNGECGLETGHYGVKPARFCDDCRYENIMAFGIAGDEPSNIATETLGGPVQ